MIGKYVDSSTIMLPSLKDQTYLEIDGVVYPYPNNSQLLLKYTDMVPIIEEDAPIYDAYSQVLKAIYVDNIDSITKLYNIVQKIPVADLTMSLEEDYDITSGIVFMTDRHEIRRGIMTELDIEVPDIFDELYMSTLIFTAGTDISLVYDAEIKWNGYDVMNDGQFVPVTGRTYEISFKNIGNNTISGRVGKV